MSETAARRVAIAIDGFRGRGGTERQVVAVARGMQQRGWIVRVLCRWGADPDDEHLAELRDAGIAVVSRHVTEPGAAVRFRTRVADRLRMRNTERRALPAFLWQQTQLVDAEIVHEIPYFGWLPRAAATIHAQLQLPVVQTVLGTPVEVLNPVAPWAVITTDGAPRVRGDPEIAWIPCMTEYVPAEPYSPHSLDRIELLFVGRLVESKGLDLLLAALQGASPRFRLTVVGDGPERVRVRQRAGRATVQFLGSLHPSDILAQLRRAHVVVVPSRASGVQLREGMPTVIAEALSQARPVLASAVGGIPTMFRLAKCPPGWVVEPDSIEALYAGLERVSASDLGAASVNASRTYEGLMSADHVLDAYEAAYDRATRERPGFTHT